MTREDVVLEALTWERTPYHHKARIRGVGVDCANLPAAVYEACGLIPKIDPEYSHQWMLNRDEELFLSFIVPYAQKEIARDQVGPGDLIVWKFGRTFSHSAIVIDYPEVIHAVNLEGVSRGNAERDGLLVDRPVKYFTLWEDGYNV
jgi:cell wall-associated NlpC family hydrolase